MLAAPVPLDDDLRVAALRSTGLLDSAPDPALDAITALAARVLGVPIVLVSLVDANRQWFLSRQGLAATETPRDIAFCGHVVASGEGLVVPNATADERFADNPLVTGPPHVAFYAGCPVRDADGNVLGTVCAIDNRPREFDPADAEMLRSLAGHVEALLQLRQVAKRNREQAEELQVFQRFFQGSLDLQCTTDMELRATRVNLAWTHKLGWRPEEVLGHSLIEFFHPDDLAATLAEAGRIVEPGQGTLNFENRVRHAEGHWVPVAWVATHRDGTFYASARDMTQFREEQARVTASRAQLREILDTVPDPVVTAREDGTVIAVNPALRRMFRYEGDTCPSAVTDLGDFGRGWPPFHDPSRTSGEPYVLEGTGTRADATSFPAEFHVGSYNDGSGRTYTCVIRDIAERDRVGRLQSEFVSTVSHELRTPLTAIRGSLGLIAGGVMGELPTAASEYVDLALNSCDRLVRLLNDILDMEKIQAGRMVFRPSVMEVHAALCTARDAVANLAQASGARIELRFGEAVGEVLADEDRLVQMVTNLLSNAVKFSPAGAVVHLAAERRDRSVRVSVRDHGPGVPFEFRRRLFQRFAQADASDRRERGGTGLGLSIAQAIVERMQGRIGVEHPPDGGSLFFFELPRVAGIADYQQASRGERGFALVLDDDIAAARAVADTVAGLGLVPHVAPTIARAREFLAQRAYALVTLDIQLPDGDGLSLVPEIRALSGGDKVAVVVVSGSQSHLLGGAAVVSNIVQKPFEVGQLRHALGAALAAVSGGTVRVLHVEDEADIRLVVRGYLPPEWEVIEARSLAEAYRALDAARPDVVLLDLCLPDGPGETLLERTGSLPVVIFSASEADANLGARVAAALVKAKLSPDQLRHIIQAAISQTVVPDESEGVE